MAAFAAGAWLLSQNLVFSAIVAILAFYFSWTGYAWETTQAIGVIFLFVGLMRFFGIPVVW
jgi:hypothetical protein